MLHSLWIAELLKIQQERETSYSKSSKRERGVIQNPAREREELLKIQQEREREELLKIQQERESDGVASRSSSRIWSEEEVVERKAERGERKRGEQMGEKGKCICGCASVM